jgi:hypothetical protein
MCNTGDIDQPLRIINVVDDAVLSDADAPAAFIPVHFLQFAGLGSCGNARILSRTRCVTSEGKSFSSFSRRPRW